MLTVSAKDLDTDRIAVYPAKESTRRQLLQWALDQVIDPGETLSEQELNHRMWSVTDDSAALRRYLVERGMLLRRTDGSLYWRSPDQDDRVRDLPVVQISSVALVAVNEQYPPRPGTWLTATANGVVPVGASLSWQWFRDDWPIYGAIKRSCQLVTFDARQAISVRCTAKAEGYYRGCRDSAVTIRHWLLLRCRWFR